MMMQISRSKGKKIWNEEDQGMTFETVDIPEDILPEATEYREALLEAVAEFDDNLMEKYFEDPDTLTEREILDALREATIGGKVVPMMCGSAFKNKGVQAMLDMVMEILPSRILKRLIFCLHHHKCYCEWKFSMSFVLSH